MLNTTILTTPFAQTLTFPLLKFMTSPIDLRSLLQGIPGLKIHGPKTNPMIHSIALHSKLVNPGSLFFALPGARTHGGSFIEEAVARGATVVVTETVLPRMPHIVQIQPRDIRACMAQMARTFYHKPDEQLTLVGITGTCGKTTTSWFLRHLYRKGLQENTGLLGSLHYDLGRRILPASLTTPDAISLTSYLREMVEAQCSHAVLEVSSHAIAQKRTGALHFDTAVFTNLSVEHLDYHRDMESYYQSKRQLFHQPHLKHAVINTDDAYGQRLWRELPTSLARISIGLNPDAMLQAYDIRESSAGTSFRLRSPQGEFRVQMPLWGTFNVYNCLAALGVCVAQGYDLAQLVPHLKTLPAVPGRMEAVKNPLGVKIFVDFAHKPEALQNVLQMTRSLTHKKVVVVFGCGGDRDRIKRPLMAKIATSYADLAFATSDNPRTESLEQIFNDMRSGCEGKTNITFLADRVEAICAALRQCEAGDCLIIAGKGHEQYQEIQGKFYPFSDKKVVEMYIATLEEQ